MRERALRNARDESQREGFRDEQRALAETYARLLREAGARVRAPSY